MGYWDWNGASIKDLEGKVIKSIDGDRGSSELIFHTQCGREYRMFHYQDCCESVYLEAVDGDLQNLVGATIYHASESSDMDSDTYGALQWTYYRIRSDREFVHLTWRGESNGYYSTSVSFMEVPREVPEEANTYGKGKVNGYA